MVLANPDSIRQYEKFEAWAFILTTEEGGRHTPFFPGYRPQFFIGTTDVTGTINLILDEERNSLKMAIPGDTILIGVELTHPIALEEGMHFAIREGGRTVGAGQVKKLIKKIE